MTDEPTTAAGRALWLGMTGGYSGPFDASARAMAAELIAIEAEARREGAAEALAAVERWAMEQAAHPRLYVAVDEVLAVLEAERKKAAETA